jgi:GNAT superfamily N-acetyltransferase
MTPYEIRKDGYLISTDKAKLNIDAIHQFLSQRSYWALERTREMVVTSIEHSLCFGVYDPDGAQAGFARAVTDYATFAWICDVFILEANRGMGLSKWLVEAMVDCPQLKGVRQMLLATRDAHRLYREYGGFVPLFGPEGWMERRNK